jgi:hypothetical protein
VTASALRDVTVDIFRFGITPRSCARPPTCRAELPGGARSLPWVALLGMRPCARARSCAGWCRPDRDHPPTERTAAATTSTTSASALSTAGRAVLVEATALVIVGPGPGGSVDAVDKARACSPRSWGSSRRPACGQRGMRRAEGPARPLTDCERVLGWTASPSRDQRRQCQVIASSPNRSPTMGAAMRHPPEAQSCVVGPHVVGAHVGSYDVTPHDLRLSPQHHFASA